MPTVIVPPAAIMPQQKCIIQQGVKYCEQTDITHHEFGGICVFVILMFLWAKIINDLYFNHPYISGFILLLPFILGSLLIFIN